MNLAIALLVIVLSAVAAVGFVLSIAYLADRSIRRKHGLETEEQVSQALADYEAHSGGR